MSNEHNFPDDTSTPIINRVESDPSISFPELPTNDDAGVVSPGRSNASSETSKAVELCRICYDSHEHEPIIYPCECKGTMGAIHLNCLERWLEESNRNNCELCGYQFQVQRTPRHRVSESIGIWICLDQRQHQLFVRSLRADLIRTVIVTPITMACSYVCIVAADFYSKNNHDEFSPARWTTYTLLAMMTLLIFSYFVWMYMVIQYHQKIWFYWWQKSSVVKVTLDEARNRSV